MSLKSTTRAAEDAAQKLRKEQQAVENQAAAVSEASRVRDMFAEDRKRLEKRYGFVSLSGRSVD
jgi:cytidylate kinase